jgi:hypothetical protein
MQGDMLVNQPIIRPDNKNELIKQAEARKPERASALSVFSLGLQRNQVNQPFRFYGNFYNARSSVQEIE